VLRSAAGDGTEPGIAAVLVTRAVGAFVAAERNRGMSGSEPTRKAGGAGAFPPPPTPDARWCPSRHGPQTTEWRCLAGTHGARPAVPAKAREIRTCIGEVRGTRARMPEMRTPTVWHTPCSFACCSTAAVPHCSVHPPVRGTYCLAGSSAILPPHALSWISKPSSRCWHACARSRAAPPRSKRHSRGGRSSNGSRLAVKFDRLRKNCGGWPRRTHRRRPRTASRSERASRHGHRRGDRAAAAPNHMDAMTASPNSLHLIGSTPSIRRAKS
jgi:hypothetical protein